MDLFDKLYDKNSNYQRALDARAADIYPYFHCLESRQAPEVIMEGKRRIMLGSNNYLGNEIISSYDHCLITEVDGHSIHL